MESAVMTPQKTDDQATVHNFLQSLSFTFSQFMHFSNHLKASDGAPAPELTWTLADRALSTVL